VAQVDVGYEPCTTLNPSPPPKMPSTQHGSVHSSHQDGVSLVSSLSVSAARTRAAGGAFPLQNEAFGMGR
jgi:hypothetical protein